VIAILRTEGKSLDIEKCVDQIPTRLLDQKWNTGDKQFGRVYTTSGFTLLLSEDDDKNSFYETILSRLKQLAPVIKETNKLGASSELDIAIEVFASAPKSIEFAPALLSMLGECTICLKVSAYPCSDDDE